jgi:uncharacterized protein (DUF58 family)
MLIPDLKELIQLRAALSNQKLHRAHTSNSTQGDYTSLFQGLGVEFETVRPYVIGDDVRYIDWRVTARSGKAHVKTFRAESDRNVFIVVDANAYMRFGTRGTFKSVQAARVAALLCWKSLQQQDRVGGLLFGDISKGIQFFAPTKTDSASLQMLRILCNKDLDQHDPVTISTALDHLAQVVTPQSLIFIISDFSMQPIAELEKSLIKLRKRCKTLLLPINDPSDYDIPDIGSIVLANGGEKVQIDTHNTAARIAYRNLWQQYQNNLTSLAKKISCPILWLETAMDPLKTLFTAGSLKWQNQ